MYSKQLRPSNHLIWLSNCRSIDHLSPEDNSFSTGTKSFNSIVLQKWRHKETFKDSQTSYWIGPTKPHLLSHSMVEQGTLFPKFAFKQLGLRFTKLCYRSFSSSRLFKWISDSQRLALVNLAPGFLYWLKGNIFSSFSTLWLHLQTFLRLR